MLRVALLKGTNINKDSDVSKITQASIGAGVVQGLNIVAGVLQPGYAFCQVERSGGVVFLVLVEVTATEAVDVTGTHKIWLEVDQAKINDGSSNAVDGSGVVTIETGASYPAGNFIKLADVTSDVVTDEREFIAKLGDETIQGIKNYLSHPTVDDEDVLPPTPNALVQKKYVDDIKTELENDIALAGSVESLFDVETTILGESVIPGNFVFKESEIILASSVADASGQALPDSAGTPTNPGGYRILNHYDAELVSVTKDGSCTATRALLKTTG